MWADPGGARAGRWALLGDVHGNLQALMAVLEHMARQRCDGVLCTGDLVNYGPAPNECVELVLAKADACVLGNHDQLLAHWAGEPAPVHPGRDPALEDTALRWTGERLGPRTRATLAALPTEVFWPAPEPRLLLVHGSPLSIEEYVTRATLDARWAAFGQAPTPIPCRPHVRPPGRPEPPSRPEEPCGAAGGEAPRSRGGTRGGMHGRKPHHAEKGQQRRC